MMSHSLSCDTGSRTIKQPTEHCSAMVEDSVVCPKCGARIPLTRALVASIETRLNKEFETKLEKEVKARLAKQATVIRSSMQEEFDDRMRQLNDELDVKNKKLKETRDLESSLRKELIGAKDKLENQKLEMERQMAEERNKMTGEIRKKLEDEFSLKSREVQQTNAKYRVTPTHTLSRSFEYSIADSTIDFKGTLEFLMS